MLMCVISFCFKTFAIYIHNQLYLVSLIIVTDVTHVTDVTNVTDVTHFAPSQFPTNTRGMVLLITNILPLVSSSRRKLKGSSKFQKKFLQHQQIVDFVTDVTYLM